MPSSFAALQDIQCDGAYFVGFHDLPDFILRCAGLGLQALQQAAGINTIMYFAPSILGLAGFQSPRSAVLASVLPAAVNALGTVVGMRLIDRAGRRCGPASSCTPVHIGLHI